jgi:DNA-binding MarR family transcriptional regulator
MNAPQPAPDGRGSILELNRLLAENLGLTEDLEEASARILARENLTPPQRRLLMSLRKVRTCTVPHLARRNGVSRQYVQTVMNQLARTGWVAFRPNPDHKRSRLLALTDRGEERIRALMAREGDLLQRVAARLSNEEARVAVAVLRRARAALKGGGA